MQDRQQRTLIYNEYDPPHPDPSSHRTTRTQNLSSPRNQNLSSPRNQNLSSPRNQNLSLPRSQNLSSPCGQNPKTQDLLAPRNQTQRTEAYSWRRAIQNVPDSSRTQNPKSSLRHAIQNVPDSSRSGLVVPAACRYINPGGVRMAKASMSMPAGQIIFRFGGAEELTGGCKP